MYNPDMTDDTPEEDKWLANNTKQTSGAGRCKHEWVDLYNSGGFVRGHIERALSTFFCKWCLQIKTIEWNQSKYNLSPPEDYEEEFD